MDYRLSSELPQTRPELPTASSNNGYSDAGTQLRKEHLAATEGILTAALNTWSDPVHPIINIRSQQVHIPLLNVTPEQRKGVDDLLNGSIVLSESGMFVDDVFIPRRRIPEELKEHYRKNPGETPVYPEIRMEDILRYSIMPIPNGGASQVILTLDIPDDLKVSKFFNLHGSMMHGVNQAIAAICKVADILTTNAEAFAALPNKPVYLDQLQADSKDGGIIISAGLGDMRKRGIVQITEDRQA